MGVGVSLALIYISRGWDPLAAKIWPAILLIYLELTIVTAVALLFSTFSSPALSALLTFFVFLIGHFSGDLKSLANTSSSGAARILFRALYYLLPNLTTYSVITPAAHGVAPDAQSIVLAAAYAVVYAAFLLAAATMIFSGRNFK
jgi:hypothetical protein